jgi:hypothetical protein
MIAREVYLLSESVSQFAAHVQQRDLAADLALRANQARIAEEILTPGYARGARCE